MKKYLLAFLFLIPSIIFAGEFNITSYNHPNIDNVPITWSRADQAATYKISVNGVLTDVNWTNASFNVVSVSSTAIFTPRAEKYIIAVIAKGLTYTAYSNGITLTAKADKWNIDDLGAGTIIDNPHRQGHEGYRYSAAYEDLDVDNGEAAFWYLNSMGARSHSEVFVSCSASGTFYIYRAKTGGWAGGTTITAVNDNGASDRVNLSKCYYNGQSSTADTLVKVIHSGSTGVSSTSGSGNGGTRKEHLLAYDEFFYVKFVSKVDNNDASVTFDWYERP